MAEKKYIGLAGLGTYDEEIKKVIDSKDAETLAAAQAAIDAAADNYDPAGTAQTKVDALAKGQVKTNTENIAKKADKATTLAGYGIADAYTKTQTDSAIATAVVNAGHLEREIVETLPTIASAKENIVYMVKKTNGSGDQHYDEYMLIKPEDGGAASLEKIGDTTADLTNYPTKSELTTAKSEAISTAGTNADAKIVSKVGDIGSGTVKSYVDEKSSSCATAINEIETRLNGLETVTYVEATTEEILALFA